MALKLVLLPGQTGPIEQRALGIIRDIRHPHLLAMFGAWQVDRVDLHPKTNRLDLIPAGTTPSDDRPTPDISGESRLVGSTPEDPGK